MDGEYEWTAHEPAALKAGVSPQIIDIVKYRKTLTGVPEREATIIALGREAVGKHKVSSETFARALKIFGDRQLVNIVCLMGDYASTAIMLSTFDQHVRPTDEPLLPIP
jgi:4-carboxymuconolactone decarboxylase